MNRIDLLDKGIMSEFYSLLGVTVIIIWRRF